MRKVFEGLDILLVIIIILIAGAAIYYLQEIFYNSLIETFLNFISAPGFQESDISNAFAAANTLRTSESETRSFLL
jgi:hypothetical protein